LDIQAADPDGHLVIIENQLEPSNHLHLGQLLVYASGLEASTAVWITTRLRDEHRSALTWLNERTDSEVKGVRDRVERGADRGLTARSGLGRGRGAEQLEQGHQGRVQGRSYGTGVEP
jgi:hypothetical protein